MSQEPKPKLNIFQRIDKIGDLFFLNLCFVIACIPIITIGAATVAMYTYTIKMVDDNEGSSVLKSFCKAFKENFKQATAAWSFILLIILVMLFEYSFSLEMTGIGLSIILALMAIEAIYLSFVLPLLFPLIARYENTTRNMLRNAFFFSISNLDKWFGLFFIWVLPIALYAASFKVLYYTWILWLVILVAVLAYASSMICLSLFEKLENKDEDDSEDADIEEISDSIDEDEVEE